MVAVAFALGGASPPSAPEITAPRLAALGAYPVGRVRIQLPEETRGPAARRPLEALVWYPAAPTAAPAQPSLGALPAGPGRVRPTPYLTPAIARPDVAPAAGPFPLVILSHGYGNAADWMSWLGENLASKGYVVVAPEHRDPAFTGAASLAAPLVFRPLDQIRSARDAPTALEARGGAWKHLVDRTRVGVVGYSMGGYGALRSAGAAPDPRGMTAPLLPSPAEPYAPGALPGLRAVVAIAPWGGQSSVRAFDPASLAKISTPVLLIVGSHDTVSGYSDGVVNLYTGLTAAPRWMLTFESAGHTIGLNPVPEEASDWAPAREMFEDAIWAKTRVTGISQHMITAFLDLTLKGVSERRAELDVSAEANDKTWSGFPPRWADGLAMRHAGTP